MPDEFCVRVFWGARAPPQTEVVQQSLRLFEGLSGIHDVLSVWYEKGMSKNEALTKQMIPSVNTLTNLMQSGRNRYDTTGEIIEDLGYSFGLWNGRDDENGLSLSISCGVTTPYVSNRCILGDIESSCVLAKPEILSQILTVIIDCFQPDWGGVYSLPYLSKQQNVIPQVAWITYLSYLYQPISTLPRGVKLIARPDHSTLIQLSDELFDSSVAEHVRRMEETTAILKQAGIVKSV